jgi:signal transduction histidine kinase
VRLSIKTKQVAGVTLLVGLAVVVLSAGYLSALAGVRLTESAARAELLAQAIYQRARDAVAANAGVDPLTTLRTDAGLRSILQASGYSKSVAYAAIVDTHGLVVAHSLDDLLIGQPLPAADDLADLLKQGSIAQARAIYTPGGTTLEVRVRLLLADSTGVSFLEFGGIRVGFSTLLIRSEMTAQLSTPIYTALGVLVGATLVAMLLAQIVLRPIHVLRTGLARLGRGEVDVSVDLPRDGDLGDLGDSFKAVTARLAADRPARAGQPASPQSVVAHLEDAVALFAPDGTLLFANSAMRAELSGDHGAIDQLLPPGHAYRTAVENSLAGRGPADPATVQLPDGERLILTHIVEDPHRRPMGVMLVARNLAYLSHVESTLSYSRKLVALGRLSAGVAHEIKNPLNATMIHLELLRMQLADQPAATEHLAVIAAQMRRLDEVVQGFLKFTRPEELTLQPVAIGALLDQVLPVIRAEAGAHDVDVQVECPADLPAVSADARLLDQALLNLGLNACQAMPNGGRLRIAASARPGRRVQITFEDTGVGIPPEDLARIFDLYFTTKEYGSGIGLSLVYRTVQLLDGEIEVQSTPGRGTTFRLLLRQAAKPPAPAAAIPAS